MNRPTQTEIIFGALLVLNLLVSLWLYQTVTAQDKRINSLERNDAIKQQVDNLNHKYDSLKDRIQGLFH